MEHNNPSREMYPWVYERNIMRRAFLHPGAREQLANWKESWAVPFLARIRTAAAQYPGNNQLKKLVAAVLRGPADATLPERIHCPVPVIHGATDTVTSVEEVMRFAQEPATLGGDHTSPPLDDGDHYLSAPAAREQALRAELDFHRRVMHRPTE